MGFALKGGAKRKREVRAVHGEKKKEEKDFVVGIGANGIKALNPKEKKKAAVIAALPNGWRMQAVGVIGGEQAKANALAKAKAKAAAEAKRPLTLEEQAILELQQDAERATKGDADEESTLVIDGGGGVAVGADSQLGAAAGRAGGADTDETYRADVESRPQEEAFESDAYADMPIDVFGKALLRGMGWDPSKGIGKNARGPVAPVEFVRRGFGHRGLGADAKPDERREKKCPPHAHRPSFCLSAACISTTRCAPRQWSHARSSVGGCLARFLPDTCSAAPPAGAAWLWQVHQTGREAWSRA